MRSGKLRGGKGLGSLERGKIEPEPHSSLKGATGRGGNNLQLVLSPPLFFNTGPSVGVGVSSVSLNESRMLTHFQLYQSNEHRKRSLVRGSSSNHAF